ncbi:MAG TPA: PLD nuclease N-terminal domain-containing protein [Thermomicrobiales bacterium]|nr:PLD nuclease N-terminal domain-containing protein [Thermomicrobiales bacterium]
MSETGAAPTWALVVVILCWAAAQYGLAAWTLRDLARRPTVNGGSKTAWALGVLAVPVIGPLAYLAVHPVPPPAWLARTPALAAAAWAGMARRVEQRDLWLARLRRGLAAARWRDRPPRWIVPPRMPRDQDVSPPAERR